MLHIYTLLLVNQFLFFVCFVFCIFFLPLILYQCSVFDYEYSVLSSSSFFFFFFVSLFCSPPPPPPPFMLRCTIVLFCYVPSLPRLFFCDLNVSVSVCLKIKKQTTFVPCNIYMFSARSLSPPPPPPPFYFIFYFILMCSLGKPSC